MVRGLAVSAFMLATFWSGLVGLWVADRAVPVRVMAAEVLNKPHPEQDLLVRFHVDRVDLCSTKIERVIVDSQSVIYTLEDIDYALYPGSVGQDMRVIRVPLPHQIAHGPARLKIISSYRCNPTHNFWPIVQVYEVPFEVAR